MHYLYVIILGVSTWASRPAWAQAPAAEMAADSGQYQVALDDRQVSSQTDSVGTCTEVLRWGERSGLVRAFYPSGRLKEYVPYSDLASGVQHGVASSWFDNGQLGAQQPYYQGQRTGTLALYYESGILKRTTEYVAGNEMLGRCFDEAGQPVAYFPYEQLPLYPGGQAQLTKEITKALRLPRHLPSAVFLSRVWLTSPFRWPKMAAFTRHAWPAPPCCPSLTRQCWQPLSSLPGALPRLGAMGGWCGATTTCQSSLMRQLRFGPAGSDSAPWAAKTKIRP
jgi:hypothetical protein